MIMLLWLFFTMMHLKIINSQTQNNSLQQTIGCAGSPLGMEHGHIKDRDIAASSTFDYHSVGPHG
jgi:hypothetical protein